MNSKLVVFDLFGTLVESPNPIRVKDLLDEIELHAYGEAGLYFRWLSSSDDRDRGLYDTSEEYWEAMKVKDAEKANLLYQRGNSYWLEKIRPGVEELLKLLTSKGFDIALCSNAGFETNNIFKNSRIRSYFNSVVISAEIKSQKPELKMYNEAVGKNRVYSQMFFIGDGGSDELQGAEKAGLKPLQLSEYKDGKEIYRDLGEVYPMFESIGTLKDYFS